ncbi:hypothetical protein GEMRC1_012974 [Eukaryota sp. GEM-RC1]
MNSTDSPHTHLRKLQDKRDCVSIIVTMMKMLRQHLPNYVDVCATSEEFRSGVGILYLLEKVHPEPEKVVINVKNHKFAHIENWKCFFQQLKELGLTSAETIDVNRIVNGQSYSAEAVTLFGKFQNYVKSKL